MIRLLDVHKILDGSTYHQPEGEELKRRQSEPYIILSHMWQENEVIHEDLKTFNTDSKNTQWRKAESAQKIIGACKQVQGFYFPARNVSGRYLWMDTVCINKSDQAETSASINSMYRWYKNAEVCFAYLSDYPSPSAKVWYESRWFTRGWTLQELVAPKNVIFFDKDWRVIGSRASLQPELTARTGIEKSVLLDPHAVNYASVSQRMSWYAGRITTVPEDSAYCLLGLFGVSMPMLYGEGAERAFMRLQEEIMRYSDDHSLFAWRSPSAAIGPYLKDHPHPDYRSSGLLASSPHWFAQSGHYKHIQDPENQKPFLMTNKGISISLRRFNLGAVSEHVVSFDCMDGERHFLGVFLRQLGPAGSKQFERIRTDRFCSVQRANRGNADSIFVKAPSEI